MANPIQPVTGQSAFVVTPSNTTIFQNIASALFVGGAGNVNVRTVKGDTVLFTGVVAGTVLPISCDQVLSTSTTATNITAITY